MVEERTHPSSPENSTLCFQPELEHAALEKGLESTFGPLGKVFRLYGSEVDQREKVQKHLQIDF